MTHFQEVVGLNPGAIYWMDMTFCTLIYCKNCFVCLKRPKINEKEAKVGPFFKKTVKKLISLGLEELIQLIDPR